MKLFIDMDGVLVDFIKQVEKYHFFNGSNADKINWDALIAEGPSFWSEMDWLPGAKAAFTELKELAKKENFELNILSSIDFEEGVAGKKEWILKKADFPLDKVIFVLNPEDKAKYASEDAILVDDREVCFFPFREAGGKVVPFTKWDECLEQIKEKIKQVKKEVFLKKEPTAIAMRIFKDDEEYEEQIMRECDLFFEKHGVYPNAIVSNPKTFNRWEAAIEDSADSFEDELENMTFDQIKKMNSSDSVCEIVPSEDEKATIFRTPKYDLFLIENEEYQDGVYQLFNGYSPVLENGKFTYPLVDMEATGKRIRELMDKKGITPTEVQNVCGLGTLQAVYKWFVGKSVPNIDNLGIISNLLNTPIDYIVVFKNREN